MAFLEGDGGRAARLVQQGPGGAAARGAHTKGSGTDPLGVESGHTVRRDYYDKLASQAASRDPNPANRGPRTFTVRTSPTYYAGAEVEEFATKDPAYVSRVQRSLEMAGLLDNYRKGFWDKPSISAMKQAMSYANQRGIGWEQAVAELIDSPLEGSAARGRISTRPVHVRRGFVAEPYMPPDYDAAKVKVRETFEKLVGRPVMDHELMLLANEMMGDYRRKYDSEMDAARRYHIAQQQELAEAARVGTAAEGEPGTALKEVHSHDVPGGVAAEQVDPEAELVEWLFRHWGSAIAENRDMPYREAAANLTRAIMAQGGQIMGGGR